MAKAVFQLHERIKIDLTNKIMFGDIEKKTLYDRFTDGRISGLLVEDLLEHLYCNLNKIQNQGASYDIEDNDGKRYEVRTVTKDGVRLVPSSQIGTRRKYDEPEHNKKLSWLYAYIFVEIRTSPIFYITGIAKDNIPSKRMLTCGDFKKLLQDLNIL